MRRLRHLCPEGPGYHRGGDSSSRSANGKLFSRRPPATALIPSLCYARTSASASAPSGFTAEKKQRQRKESVVEGRFTRVSRCCFKTLSQPASQIFSNEHSSEACAARVITVVDARKGAAKKNATRLPMDHHQTRRLIPRLFPGV